MEESWRLRSLAKKELIFLDLPLRSRKGETVSGSRRVVIKQNKK